MKKRILIIGLLSCTLIASASAQKALWRHVDKSGHVTYTDQPMKGSKGEEVDVIAYPPAIPMPVNFPSNSDPNRKAFGPANVKDDKPKAAHSLPPLPATPPKTKP
ncbi:DUF4124 domain-containing protein [Duganella sp. PWIR1]